jgi:hypothetical protein
MAIWQISVGRPNDAGCRFSEADLAGHYNPPMPINRTAIMCPHDEF